MHDNQKNIDIINQYIEDNCEEIAEKVDEYFVWSKGTIWKKVIAEIKSYLESTPEHYDWEPSKCTYDCSGKIVKNGKVDLNQTISEFLENERTGAKEATYISGCGYDYPTYGDDLSELTRDIGHDLLIECIRDTLDAALPIDISEDDIINAYYDNVYDNCIANEFFFWEGAIEFLNIGNVKLSDLVAKE